MNKFKTEEGRKTELLVLYSQLIHSQRGLLLRFAEVEVKLCDQAGPMNLYVICGCAVRWGHISKLSQGFLHIKSSVCVSTRLKQPFCWTVDAPSLQSPRSTFCSPSALSVVSLFTVQAGKIVETRKNKLHLERIQLKNPQLSLQASFQSHWRWRDTRDIWLITDRL